MARRRHLLEKMADQGLRARLKARLVYLRSRHDTETSPQNPPLDTAASSETADRR